MGPAVPFADEAWQVAGMIDVSVGEDDGADGCDWERERPPVHQPQFFQPLKEATIDQEALTARVQQELRAGDRADSTVKAKR